MTLYESIKNGTINKAYTHSGAFHADDVFASALLKIINPDIKITRVGVISDDIKEDDSAIVFDIGGGEFDHHDTTKLIYRDEVFTDANGNVVHAPYAAFGLLWRAVGYEFFDNRYDIAESYDKIFVQYIDYTDNTGIRFPSSISNAIKSFVASPRYDTLDEKFNEAVQFAKSIMENDLARLKTSIEDETYVEACWHMSPSRIIILPEYRPYNNFVLNKINTNLEPANQVLFVLYPSNREAGHWCIGTVKDIDGPICPIELDPSTPGLTFVHKDKFLADFTDKDSAINAVNYMLDHIHIEQYEYAEEIMREVDAEIAAEKTKSNEKVILFEKSYKNFVDNVFCMAAYKLSDRGIDFGLITKNEIVDYVDDDKYVFINLGESDYNSNSIMYYEWNGNVISAFGKIWLDLFDKKAPAGVTKQLMELSAKIRNYKNLNLDPFDIVACVDRWIPSSLDVSDIDVRMITASEQVYMILHSYLVKAELNK